MYQSSEQHYLEAQETREREEREAQEARDQRDREARERRERDAQDRKDAARHKERAEERREKRKEERDDIPQAHQDEQHEEAEKNDVQPERHPGKPNHIETNLRRNLLDGSIASAVASRGETLSPTVASETPERKAEPSKSAWTKEYNIKNDGDSIIYSRDGSERIRDEGRIIKTADDQQSIKDGVKLAVEHSKESGKKFTVQSENPEKRAEIFKEIVRQDAASNVKVRENEMGEFTKATHDVVHERHRAQKLAREEQQQEKEQDHEYER